MVQQNDEKHEEAHSRIRADHRSLEQDVRVLRDRFDNMQRAIDKLQTSVDGLKDAKVDVGAIMFDWRMVIGIVGLVTSIVSGNWFVNAPMRENLADMKESLGIMHTQMDANTKLQDERAKNTAAELSSLKADLKTGLELRRMEIATLQTTLQDKLRAR